MVYSYWPPSPSLCVRHLYKVPFPIAACGRSHRCCAMKQLACFCPHKYFISPLPPLSPYLPARLFHPSFIKGQDTTALLLYFLLHGQRQPRKADADGSLILVLPKVPREPETRACSSFSRLPCQRCGTSSLHSSLCFSAGEVIFLANRIRRCLGGLGVNTRRFTANHCDYKTLGKIVVIGN